jgi:hypothetical protein
MLANDPSILPPGLVTGFFGLRTYQALHKFQQKFGIASTTTGFFGPKTRGYMKEHCGEREGQENEHEGAKVRPPMMGSTTMPSIVGIGGHSEGRDNSGGRGGRDD